MWISRYRIKLKLLSQDASYRRLAWALGLSLLLHLFLIGNFNFNLPNWKQRRDVIEVRLVLPKVVLRTNQKPVEEIKPMVESVKLDAPRPPKETSPKETLPKASTPPPNLDLSTPADMPANENIVASESPLIPEPLAENQMEAIVPLNKPKPYEYLESDFDVYTDNDSEPNRTPVGRAKVVYHQLPNREQYQLKSLIQAKGLASLVIPDLLQTSEGFLDGIGLQPVHYLYQFGDKKDKTFHADFDWQNKKLTLRSEKSEEKLDLPEGTQDLLSFMYQFMFVPPLQNMQLNITNGKKLGVYDYIFNGEEVVTTSMGNLNTFHLERVAAEGEKKTELWLALDYQHVPVKIRETDKQGKVYELLVTGLKTELSVAPQE